MDRNPTGESFELYPKRVEHQDFLDKFLRKWWTNWDTNANVCEKNPGFRSVHHYSKGIIIM
jgi:hypothetical protein